MSDYEGEERRLPSEVGLKMEHLEGEFAKLDRVVRAQAKSLSRVERKVFNGFGSKIDAVEQKVDRNLLNDEKSHEELKDMVKSQNKTFIIFFSLIFAALLTVLGSVWLRSSPKEGRIDAPITTTNQSQ